MHMMDIANECKRWAAELTGLRRGKVGLPSRDSASMLMPGWIRAIKVRILTAHEAALLVV
jgi:hypothetical protein